ncbi:MAG: sugar phosphate nucleotidyltransferase, partial [Limnohabitans sp.]
MQPTHGAPIGSPWRALALPSWTLGIQPTFPNTGFGYIEFDKSDANPIKKVNQFREKPDYETAKSFLDAGNFLWNG